MKLCFVKCMSENLSKSHRVSRCKRLPLRCGIIRQAQSRHILIHTATYCNTLQQHVLQHLATLQHVPSYPSFQTKSLEGYGSRTAMTWSNWLNLRSCYTKSWNCWASTQSVCLHQSCIPPTCSHWHALWHLGRPLGCLQVQIENDLQTLFWTQANSGDSSCCNRLWSRPDHCQEDRSTLGLLLHKINNKSRWAILTPWLLQWIPFAAIYLLLESLKAYETGQGSTVKLKSWIFETALLNIEIGIAKLLRCMSNRDRLCNCFWNRPHCLLKAWSCRVKLTRAVRGYFSIAHVNTAVNPNVRIAWLQGGGRYYPTSGFRRVVVQYNESSAKQRSDLHNLKYHLV